MLEPHFYPLSARTLTGAELAAEESYRLRLCEIVADSGLISVIRSIQELLIGDMWLAGGAVRNTVWQRLYGSQCGLPVKDYDVAFFERDTFREREAEIKSHLLSRLPGLVFDVKNQASFGVWRQGRFLFQSTADGISNWLLTTAAVGIALKGENQLHILAPYGLSDLFQGIVRPTPRQARSEAAEAKKAELLAQCSRLRSAAWED